MFSWKPNPVSASTGTWITSWLCWANGRGIRVVMHGFSTLDPKKPGDLRF